MKQLPGRCFSRCTNLNQVNLMDGLEEIGPCCFESCHSLMSLQIPGSVHEISPDSFEDCSHLMLFVSSDSYAANYAKDVGMLFSEN